MIATRRKCATSMVTSCLLLLACVAFAQVTSAQQFSADSSGVVRVSLGGFADVYYAYDFQRPLKIDRPFTTQAGRHNEFNVSLALPAGGDRRRARDPDDVD